MYTSQRYHHNYMESNKENFSSIENGGGNHHMFMTPSKNRSAFDIMGDNPFQTPASYGSRCQPGYPPLEDIPIQALTNSKAPLAVPETVDQRPDKGRILTFDELQAFGTGIGLDQIAQVVKSSFNGKPHEQAHEKFDSITYLRSLNKYNPNNVRDIFSQFGDEILKSLSSEFILIQKHILVFVSEVLSIPKEVPLDPIIVSKLIPLMVERATSQAKEVRQQAKAGLEYITIHLTCNESLMAFAAESIPNLKRRHQTEIAFRGLAYSVELLGENLCRVDDRSLKGIFVALAKSMHTPYHHGVLDMGKRVLNQMSGLMGFDNIVRLLKSLIDENSVTHLEANTLVEEIAKSNSKNFQEKSLQFRQMVQQTKNTSTPARGTQDMPIEITFDKRTAATLGQQTQMGNIGHHQSMGGPGGFQPAGTQQWH